MIDINFTYNVSRCDNVSHSQGTEFVLRWVYLLFLTSQRDQLLKAGCEKLFEEKLTGAERKRTQLARLLNEIENGDTLVITGLDRLVRSTHDLLKITRTLDDRGIEIRSLEEPWADTTAVTGGG